MSKRRRSSNGNRHDRRKSVKPTGDRATSGRREFGRDSDQANPASAKAKAETEAQIREWLGAAIDQPVRRPAGEIALDPWQEQVLAALMAGESVVVDAPTTAGKTRAVEVFFRAKLNDPRFRAAYTTPVKSLSNDKLREFRAMFGSENVGIATGDIKENLHAPLVVATLESYRNSLLGVEPDLGRTLVVFDEYHYLQDESRGSSWEEALILTPQGCQVLLLSASVANAEQFTEWLQEIHPHRACRLVRTEKRPVPLVDLVFHGGNWLLPSTLPSGAGRPPQTGRPDAPVRQETIAERAEGLLQLGLTPTIVYCGRRLSCETMAALICRQLSPLSPAEAERIGASLAASQEEFRGLSFISPNLRQMLQVYGVGFHHSGLAAPARMAVEALVKDGLLRFCAATMGLSLGINFSVRSALIADYQRPGELGFTDYAPSEVLQMLGRAGRRGKDAVGFSLWPSPIAYKRLGNAKRDRIESRLRSDPTTFLGLVGRGFSLRAIENFYSKSFRRFTDQGIDLSLMTKSRLVKKLGAKDLPCDSPAAAVAAFWNKKESPCGDCRLRSKCHPILKAKNAGSLAALHVHLHKIGALNPDESLSNFGSIARYFPQAGGLVMARLIADRQITPDNLSRAVELAASMTLARFKEPGTDARYRLPFGEYGVEDMLLQMYPYELFPEVYDPPFRQRSYPVIREYNPAAGYIVREWIQGMPWKDLITNTTHEQYGTGDVMSLILRSATYLQSVIQADIPQLADLARDLRSVMLREPLSFVLAI